MEYLINYDGRGNSADELFEEKLLCNTNIYKKSFLINCLYKIMIKYNKIIIIYMSDRLSFSRILFDLHTSVPALDGSTLLVGLAYSST